MPIIRRKLDPNTVYPTTIRYNPDTDTVQTNINGTWTDSPEADPRHQTTFPPRITSNPQCDAAQSVADAFKGQIDQILTAIDNGQTAFTIAGLVLGLFTFGVFDIFVAIALAIANAMLDAGTASLEAALTGAVWDQFVCILDCHMNSQGRVKPGEFSQITDDVNAQIGELAAIVLDSFLQLAGEGGVNNLASLGTSTGDCTSCDDCGISCGSPDLITEGTVLEQYVEDGRLVLRVESYTNPAAGGFEDVSIGIYGGGIGTYPCCHIYAWTHYSGSTITTTGYTNCSGGVVDPGNPETHDVVSAYWSNGIGNAGNKFIMNIVFGT